MYVWVRAADRERARHGMRALPAYL